MQSSLRPGATRRGGPSDLLGLVGVVVALGGFYLSTYFVHAYVFPVGPDAPVYVFWARLASHDGLSAVGGRPGVPAITLVLGAALQVGPAAIVASLEIVLAVCVALAAIAIVANQRSVGGRASWIAAGCLAGLFAAHLALGYVATLAAASLVLAAWAAVAGGANNRREAALAAVLLSAAGFAHPEFMAIGAAVLIVTSVLGYAVVRGAPWRGESARIAAAVAGGALLFALGYVALRTGPPPLVVDTSRDDFLKHAGLGSWLVTEFRERLTGHAYLWVPEVALPLAVVGAWRSSGSLQRSGLAWGIVLVGGGGAAYVTGVFPAERLATFAFIVPILAGVGSVTAWRWIAGRGVVRWILASVAALALLGAMAAGALVAWERTPPELFPTEVARVNDAARYIEATAPGTHLVFTAISRQPIASFFATQAANAIRTAVPPDRIRDVYVIEPADFPDASLHTEEGQRLVVILEQAAFGDSSPSLWFDLAPFDRTHFGQPFSIVGVSETRQVKPRVVSPGVAIVGSAPSPGRAPSDPLEPTSMTQIAWVSAVSLGLMWIVGYGWARVAIADRFRALALAPAVGTAALILAGIAADRAGVSIGTTGGGSTVAIVVGVAGYAVWLSRRLFRHGPPSCSR